MRTLGGAIFSAGILLISQLKIFQKYKINERRERATD
jgi:hypothetical protein